MNLFLTERRQKERKTLTTNTYYLVCRRCDLNRGWHRDRERDRERDEMLELGELEEIVPERAHGVPLSTTLMQHGDDVLRHFSGTTHTDEADKRR